MWGESDINFQRDALVLILHGELTAQSWNWSGPGSKGAFRETPLSAWIEGVPWMLISKSQVSFVQQWHKKKIHLWIQVFRVKRKRKKERKKRIPSVQVTSRKERYTSLTFTILVNTLKAELALYPKYLQDAHKMGYFPQWRHVFNVCHSY